MPFLGTLEIERDSLWVASELGHGVDGIQPVAWDEVVAGAAATRHPTIVLDAVGLSADQLLHRFRHLAARLAPGGQLVIAHGDHGAVLAAVRTLHGEGWLARVIEGETHKLFAFARGTTTLSLDDYLALLMAQALLVAPPHRAARGPAVQVKPYVQALLNAQTASPTFGWLVDRALGSAHVLARVGNAQGPSGRAKVMSALVYRSVKDVANRLGKYSVRRVRALRPRTAPEPAQAVRDDLVARAATVPDSDGSRYYAPLPVRIGVVTDEFLWNGIKDTAAVTLVTPDNFRDVDVDMFLFIACWYGMNQWPQIGHHRASRIRLLEAIDHFNLRDVPTVFWSIEDPPHYDDFVEIAQRCRHVYTTTAEMVGDYQRDCANRRVDVLPFGVNPLIHNPIGSGRRRSSALFFAGSWYQQYPERSTDMANAFDGILAAGRELVVADRCYLRGNPSFDFPAAYQPYTIPPIDHRPLQRVQKLYDWCLNFNSVKHSATMFANRVPELQAQGVAVMSNYSRSVDAMYPHVFTVTDAGQVAAMLGSLTPDELRAHQMIGVRAVMDGQTYFEKMEQVCRDVGLPARLPRRRVLVVADRLTDLVRACFAAQVLREERRLVAASELSPALVAAYDFVAFWPPDAAYGAFHLQDRIHAFKYTNARYVVGGEPAHEFTATLDGKHGAMFATSAFSFDELSARAGIAHRAGLDSQNTEPSQIPFGNAAHALSALPTALAGGYRVPEERSQPAAAGAPARLTVVVPQRDQAARIWSKCVLSVRRHPGRPPVDLLILDDGSTDPATAAWLASMRRCAGVRVEALPPGDGSRWARAWRAAAARVTTPYVLFADPAAEVVHGAIERVADVLAAGDAAVILGRCLELSQPLRRSTATAAPPVRAPGKDLLARMPGGEPPPLVAMIVRTELLASIAAPADPDDRVARVALLEQAGVACATEVTLCARYTVRAPSGRPAARP